MHQAVSNAFFQFNETFEGLVHWMYLDVKGLVTIGLGNLIDPIKYAIKLPFEYDGQSGSRATEDEIIVAWTAVKEAQYLKNRSYQEFKTFNNLRLSSEAIYSLVSQRLIQEESFLKQVYFSNFENWPADAQLACLSMAWAMGSGFPSKFPKFRQACQEEDWDVAGAECTINETGNPGVKPRNNANRTLFSNAARVIEQELDLSSLFYPTVLLSEIIITPEEP